MDRPRRQKQPEEKRTLPFDFASKLAAGDHLVGSLGGNNGVTAEPGLDVSNIQRNGDIVTAQFSAGADGVDYVAEATWGTVFGDLLRLDVLIEVRSDQN